MKLNPMQEDILSALYKQKVGLDSQDVTDDNNEILNLLVDLGYVSYIFGNYEISDKGIKYCNNSN